jgi:hypothetical protein
MQNEELYKAWLPKNGVKAAVDNYVSCLKSMAEVLGDPLDNLDAFIKAECAKINKKNFPKVVEGVRNDYRTGLRKYWKFVKDKKNLELIK